MKIKKPRVVEGVVNVMEITGYKPTGGPIWGPPAFIKVRIDPREAREQRRSVQSRTKSGMRLV